MIKNIARLLQLIARIWAILVLAFLAFMFGAHAIETLMNSNLQFSDAFEHENAILSFFLFPITLVIGLGLAFKNELLGGLIAILGTVVYFVLNPRLATDPTFNLLAFPGLLFIIHWVLKRWLMK